MNMTAKVVAARLRRQKYTCLDRSAVPAKFTFSNTLMKTWLLIHQSDTLQKRAEKNVLGKVGLTTQMHSILLAISNLPQPVKVIDVARWLHRNPTAISMLIDQMEQNRLIERVRDTNDHRAVSLAITEKGLKIYRHANMLTGKLFQDFFGDLSADELKILCGLMEKVRTRAFNIVNPGKSTGEIQTLADNEEMTASLAKLTRDEDNTEIAPGDQ